MALIIWMPMLGTIANQGVSNLPASTVNTMEVISSGKIGKCMKGNLLYHYTTDPLSEDYSFSTWYKYDADWPTGNVIVYCKNTSEASNCQCYFSIYQSGTKLRYLGAEEFTYSYTFSKNIWYHLAITCKGNVVSLYINGIKVQSKSVSATTTSLNLGIGCRGANSSGTSYVSGGAGYFNDVRIYDHAISDKEVEIISRGLSGHWPLTGGKSGANLAKGTNTASTDTNTFGFSEATGGSSRTIEIVNGVNCAKITRNTTAHSSWSFLWYNNWDRNAIKPDTWYTLSMDVTASGSGSIGLSAFMQTNATNSITDTVETVQSSFNSDGWSHIVYHIHTISSFDGKGTNQLIYMNCSYLNNVSVWLMMKNFHLEEGKSDSSWMPHTSDPYYISMGYDSIEEPDVSGYTRHGKMKYGSYSSDTARYSVSGNYIGTTVDTSSNTTTGAQWFIAPIEMPQSKAITVAYWTKGIKYGRGGIFCTTNSVSGDYPNTDYNTTAICNWDSNMRLYLTSGSVFNYFTQLSTQLTDNKWHHHCVTYDGTTAKYYQDGVLKSSSNITGDVPAYNGICMGLGRAGGVWRQIQECASDVRIYATALTATQIAELYNTAISISNNGTLMGYELVEQ